MKLENFEIGSTIELRAGNLFWDLHNVFQFCGLEFVPGENAAVMRWNVPSRSNHSADTELKFSGISLRFKNLQFLQVGARDGDLPLTEDTCIWDVLKVDPNVEHVDPYMRARRDWNPADSFRLVFRFQSLRVIEIESEAVELLASSQEYSSH